MKITKKQLDEIKKEFKKNYCKMVCKNNKRLAEKTFNSDIFFIEDFIKDYIKKFSIKNIFDFKHAQTELNSWYENHEIFDINEHIKVNSYYDFSNHLINSIKKVLNK